MTLMEKLVSFVSKGESIIASDFTNISTRYGIFKIKAYKYDDFEFLVIMSSNFYNLDNPMVYVHTNFHMHNDPDSNIRYLNNEINTTLKIIHKVGGLMIYPSSDGKTIDTLLEQINARKLEVRDNRMKKEKIDLGFQLEDKEYQPICLILKNLNLANITLVTSDIKLLALTERIGINVTKRVSAIAFEYGK